jgi:hypothetical protein
MSAATDGPRVTDILASKEFQVAMGKAWKESFSGNDLYIERGGWVYTDSNNLDKYLVVQLSHLQNLVQGTNHTFSCDIRLDNPEKDGVPEEKGKNYKVVADFHTHPVPGQSQRPCSDDVSKAYERGVPGIVVSCSGVFYYGPQSRDSMDGPAGYPRTSSEQYKGQKEVRFGDNTVDTEGRCKP